ncbi:MAG: 4Fe-4S binding protein [Gammaproteobacteria bacterium]|nr:4Fe-4S binding protein [Gammaproteobacteria bacterium]MCW8910776.1 4Fe-4S binding protein [Gammaproteobacteria bacterium]MCW9004902.1 4Fe-4S binding protein [Gammaproteobacteria bacterium]MCW9054973.1 4Fe-4S binding protein [Gammaproteobacteria bacterium]
MPNHINISVLRKLVQLAAFLFLVYGSVIVGFYSVDKISNALPALSCAYDTKTADYCTLIPLQHRMDHDLGRAILAGTSILTALMPGLVILSTFLIMFVVLNKAFCGWICPLGFFQEILTLIGQKLGLRRIESLPEKLVQRIRPFKWLMLTVLIFGLPILAGMGVVSNELGSPFCRICPSRILTSMATGDATQMYIDTSSTAYFILSLIANLLFGLMIAWGLFFRQPFCRICPMLALHAVFKKIGLVRLVKNAKPRCEKCGLCAKACPMDIKEIHTDMVHKDVLFSDCTLCGRCVEFCPDKDVLQMKYAFMPIISADPQYFKRRKKSQTQWEKKNLLGKK